MKKSVLVVLLFALLCFALCFAACDGFGGGNHKHSVTFVEPTESTCEIRGHREYWQCTECNRMFADEDATRELDPESVLLGLKEHDKITVVDKTPTCTQVGYSHTECSVCHQSFGEMEVPFAAHTTDIHVEGVDPTCTDAGVMEHWQCSVCNTLFLDKEGQNAVDESQLVLSAINHRNATYVPPQSATCEEDGNCAYWACPDCNKNFVEFDGVKQECDNVTEPALTHKLAEHGSANAPTCADNGNLEYWRCERCNKYFSDEEMTQVLESVTLDPLHHKNVQFKEAQAPTCTEEGWTAHWSCPDCGAAFQNEQLTVSANPAIPALLVFQLNGDKYTVTANNMFESVEIELPETYNDLPVTEIGANAFYNSSYITKFTGTKNLAKIGRSAFHSCAKLQSVILAEGTSEVGAGAFGGCAKLAEVTFPSTLTVIEDDLFSDCASLAKFVIGDTVISVGSHAFSFCTSLKEVVVGSAVVSLGLGVFENCSALEKVEIGKSVTEIGHVAFSGCEKLSQFNLYAEALQTAGSIFYNTGFAGDGVTVTIGKDVQIIPDSMFDNLNNVLVNITGIVFEENSACTQLGEKCFQYSNITQLVLPTSVQKIGQEAFAYSPDLLSADLGGTTEIADLAFWGCSALATVQMDKLTTLGQEAFAECGLTSLTIPATLQTWGEKAFEYCTSLQTLTLTEGLQAIGAYAFHVCEGLTSVTLPNSVTEIGDYAFLHCTALQSVNFGFSLRTIGEGAFENCFALAKIDLSSGITSVGADAFRACLAATELTIGASVTEIGNGAFTYLSALQHLYYNIADLEINDATLSVFEGIGEESGSVVVHIGADVEKIPANLFSYMRQISDLQFAENSKCKEIGGGAFSGCSIEVLQLPQSLEYIGTYAFCYCSALKEIHLEENLGLIDTRAFADCASLTDIYLNAIDCRYAENAIYVFACVDEHELRTLYVGENVQNVAISVDNKPIVLVLDGVNNLTLTPAVTADKVYVDSLEDWLSVNIENFGSSIFSPDGELYFDGQLVTEVVIPDNVTEIGANLFYNYNKLTTLTIGSGVQFIGDNAFTSCKSLETINFNAIECALETDHGFVTPFYMASTDLVVNIGKDVKSIPDDIFYGANVSQVNFAPDCALQSIGQYAFYDNKISSLILPQSLLSLGHNAFAECRKLEELFVPATLEELGSGVFSENIIKRVEAPSKVLNASDLMYVEEVVVNGGDSLAISYSPNLTKITFAAMPAVIRNYAFSGFNTLAEVHITDIDAWCMTEFGNEESSPLHLGAMLYIDGAPATELEITHAEFISPFAFYGYADLKSVVMGDSVQSIGEGAFRNCTGLRSITIPKNVKKIGDKAFYGCTFVETMFYNAKECEDFDFRHETFQDLGKDAKENTTAYIGKDVEVLPAYIWKGEVYVKSVQFEDDSHCVTIGAGAFYLNYNLKEALLASTIETIGASAFLYCNNLLQVELPKNLVHLGGSAFSSCSKLNKVTLSSDALADLEVPDSDQYAAFYNAGISAVSLTVEVSANATRIPANLFTYSEVQKVIFREGSVCETIGEKAFEHCFKLESVQLAPSVKNIGARAFFFCLVLSDVTFGGVETIGDEAFNDCRKLAAINLPDTLKSIGAHAFSLCAAVTQVSLGNGVESIGEGAFRGSTGFKTLVLPNSLKTIGDSAFRNCKFVDIYVGTGLETVGENVFYSDSDVWKKDRVFITDLNAWCNIIFANKWSSPCGTFGTDLYLNGQKAVSLDFAGVTAINPYAFSEINSVQTITIPFSVKYIAPQAFSGTYCGLKEVYFDLTSDLTPAPQWGYTKIYKTGPTQFETQTFGRVDDAALMAQYLRGEYIGYFWTNTLTEGEVIKKCIQLFGEQFGS